MRVTRVVVLVAALMLIVSIVLVVSSRSGQGEYGWFAYAPGSDSITGPSTYLLGPRERLGWAMGWLGSLLLTAAVTYGLARRRGPSA